VKVRVFWWWIEFGVKRGWISRPVCATHEGVPCTEEEEERWEDGDDPCQHVVRLWP
jgi:hypothetical protein